MAFYNLIKSYKRKTMCASSIYDIDFKQLYKKHKAQAGRPKSLPQKWDQKAAALSVGNLETPYTTALLNALDLQSSDTLLDVGCGSGAVAVLAAARVQQVYALDFSQGMLDKLLQNAHHYGAHNILTLCKDWDEEWTEVPRCDVVVASRSTLVEDMGQALEKLEAQAKRHVYLTYPAMVEFGASKDVDAQEQPQLATPSYLYILAILHQMGRRAQLRFISNDSTALVSTQKADWALIDWAL